MKVVLTQRVTHLGSAGEIVSVSQGYARNFLFPRCLAVQAGDADEKRMEEIKKRLNSKIEEEKNRALELKEKIQDLVLEFKKKVTKGGQTYGGVTPLDISKQAERKGFELERRLIYLENPIKSLGEFKVKATLFPSVDAFFHVKVVEDISGKKKELDKKKRKVKKTKPTDEKKAETKESEPQIEQKTEIKDE